MNVESDPHWSLPIEPLTVQSAALEFAQNKNHVGWFIDAGLGKTYLTLADYSNRWERGISNLMIVVCPASLKYNWAISIEEVYPEDTFNVFMWPKIKEFDPLTTKNPIIIINYEILNSKGIEWFETFIRKFKSYVVFDESTYLINPLSKRSKAAMHLAGVADAVRLLTGTPNPESIADLYSQLICLRVNLNRFTVYRKNFCVEETRYVGKIQKKVVVGAKNEDQLAKLIGNKLFYAKKEDWAKDLPNKMYNAIAIDMTKNQKEIYTSMVEDLYAKLRDKVITVQSSIGALMKLQQISTGYITDDEKNIIKIDDKENPKLDAVEEIIHSTNGKVIIFAYYKASIFILRERFPRALLMLGMDHMSKFVLEEQKKIFNTDNDKQLIIIQQEVGKYGHTLLGTKERPCDITIYLENRYSSLSREQSEDRNNRIGAMHSVNLYYDLLCSNIDRNVLNCLKRKKDVAEVLEDTLKSYLNGR